MAKIFCRMQKTNTMQWRFLAHQRRTECRLKEELIKCEKNAQNTLQKKLKTYGQEIPSIFNLLNRKCFIKMK